MEETLSNEQKQWFLKHKQELMRVANVILNTMQVLEAFDTQHAIHAKELAKDILNLEKEIKL